MFNKPSITHKGNVISIEKPEGKYTVLYGVHIFSQDPTEISEDTDAVILETGVVSYLDNPQEAFNSLKEHIQYKRLIEYLEKKRIPVIFTDVKYKFHDSMLLLLDNGSAALKWFQGMKMLKNKDDKRNQAERIIIGGWLILPILANTVRLVSVISKVGLKQSAQLKKLANKLHPETDLLYLTVRNLLMAEKNAFLIKKIGLKKHLTTVLGAGHVGIEDMLLMEDEKRLGRINRLMPIIRKFVNKEYLYKAVQYVYNGREWEVEKVFEIPTLKSLA